MSGSALSGQPTLGYPGRAARRPHGSAPNGLLPRTVRIQDVADTAAFLASDRAAALTATTLNLSLGAVLG